ncbi:MAG TPA: DUF433 domain-containing protein [Hanamia sp.]|nr:DUF433 domain-containing protein [Hanamia sp.]
MNYTEFIESNPDIMLGKPVIRGTRITVELIIQKLSDGASHQQLLEAYPTLTANDILAALAYASEVISNETIIALS